MLRSGARPHDLFEYIRAWRTALLAQSNPAEPSFQLGEQLVSAQAQATPDAASKPAPAADHMTFRFIQITPEPDARELPSVSSEGAKSASEKGAAARPPSDFSTV